MIPSLKKLIRKITQYPILPAVIKSVRQEGLTYLDEQALLELYESVQSLEGTGAEGMIIEAGCALGGSAIVMASAKSKTRTFVIYDVFGMIPPPSERDGPDAHRRYQIILSGSSEGIRRKAYYGYEGDLFETVVRNFSRYHLSPEDHNIQLIQGLFEQTLQVSQPVALAHIDGDWYDSVMVCLERIAPHLVPGGRFVIDDYDDWSGCKSAVDEFFHDKEKEFEFHQKSRLHILRK